MLKALGNILLLLVICVPVLIWFLRKSRASRKHEHTSHAENHSTPSHPPHTEDDHAEKKGDHGHSDHNSSEHNAHDKHGHGDHHGPDWPMIALSLSALLVASAVALWLFEDAFGGPAPATTGAQALAARSARPPGMIQTGATTATSEIFHGVAPTGANWLTITPPKDVRVEICREDDPDCRAQTVVGVTVLCRNAHTGVGEQMGPGRCEEMTEFRLQSASNEQVPVFWFFKSK